VEPWDGDEVPPEFEFASFFFDDLPSLARESTR